MIEKQQEELRRRVAEIQSRKPTRRRYPEDLRQAVSSYAREHLCHGGRHKEICGELFLSPATMMRWMRQWPRETPGPQAAGMFRAVAVVREESRHRTENIFGAASCSLTTPAGYRVEGLCVEQIVYVLRELR
jgi:transposase-like protein